MSSGPRGYRGFSTKEALLLLKSEIDEIIDAKREVFSKSSFRTKFRQSLLHHSCEKSIYHWIDFVLGCISVVLLLIGYLGSDEHINNLGLVGEVIILGAIVCGDVFITCREDALLREESLHLLQSVLKDMHDVAYESPWYPYNYLNPNCPIAPSVSVQWTFRDDELVNLPCTLLVKGDLILLRPGQTVPIRCVCVEDLDNEEMAPTYELGDIYLPNMDNETEEISAPKQHTARQPKLYCVDETFFTSKVRSILSAGSERPSSLLQNEIYSVKTRIVYSIILPSFTVLVLVANLIRYIWWTDYSGYWTELVFILPVQTILPVLVIVLPPLYLVLHWFGTARLHLSFKRAADKEKKEPCIDADVCSDDVKEWHVDLQSCEVLSAMKKIALGESEWPCRTVEFVHVLGSVTAVCCLDKKGILSWPLPSMEKVFLLTSRNQTDRADPAHQVLTSIRETGESDDDLDLPIEFSRDAQVEVLDVSHEPNNPYDIMFDDPNWRRHIDSLKPLGLNILLNTCNMNTADSYTQFGDHISVAAHAKSESVAVVNRRCLCELPRQVGFSDQAMDSFELLFDICMYKHVDDVHTRSKLLQKSFIKHKTPMPHMMSVVVQEMNTGSQQLMTHGTADIMLDLCSDYWNGKDLVPLLDTDRKRILDFYHRQSMTAYCLSFAYSPIIDKLSHKLGDKYVQLPGGSFHTYPDFNSPTATVHSFDLESLENKSRKFDRRFSADSAIGRSEQVVADLDGCIRSQSNQIFIGMVTMQYQAITDVVQLIEQLENACIRFVHFSKENELRSRVFSEKLGLESGWNCHISLLSEHGDHMSSRSSSHHQLPSKRALSNSSIRHSTHSISREVSPRRSTDEDDVRAVLLGHRSSKSSVNDDEPANDVHVRICDSRSESVDRTAADEGIHGSVSNLSSHSSDSMVIDSQNRAKLPKGIENIRPHLQNVDNVPLLVSLFTDCTPPTTHEMIKIMQENGEVVCVLGSTANYHNIDLFLQADACIGLEPLYPNVCIKHPPVLELLETEFHSPMTLSNKLNGLPCSLAFHRQANVDLRSLILEARSHTLLTRNCLQFYLCCSLAVSLIQVVNSVLLLPPIWSTRHVIWLVFVIVPVLSSALVWHGKPDERLSTMATGKNRRLRLAPVVEFAVYAVGRFIPTIAICILCFGLNLYFLCNQMSNASCHLWFGNRNATGTQNWAGWYAGQRFEFCMAQNFALAQMVLYLILISVSFVHRNSQLWQRHPFDNITWIGVVPILCVLQVVFTAADLSLINGLPNSELVDRATAQLPLATWIVAVVWIVLLPIINELIKRREISSSVRYQKRAKLDFGTKLGMNSPF